MDNTKNKIYDVDMRISISHETKHSNHNLASQAIKDERIKERTSFQIAWTRIDLTVVK